MRERKTEIIYQLPGGAGKTPGRRIVVLARRTGGEK
jgi:hypothetical protein